MRIYVLILLFVCQCIIGQENNPKKLFKNVVYFLDIGYYEEALDIMVDLYKTDPDNPNFNYLLGKCYFNITPKKYDSEPYLLAASSSVERAYVKGDFKYKGASPETNLMLGELYHFDNKLDLAENYYTRYKEMIVEPEALKHADHLIKSISRARRLEKTRIPYYAENLGSKINTPYSDYNPVFSFDGSAMAYTSYQNSEDRIFLSRNINGEWSSPEDISEQIHSTGKCFTAAMSYNGNKLYLICIDEVGSDIYSSEYNGKSWSAMKSFDSRINSAYYETSFYINATEDLLYFSSNAPNGFGGQDLYFSKKDEKGEWSYPENLGARINSNYDEEYPYLSRGGEILFFSSNGHSTMGGFDVFYSQRIGDEVWTKPINAGYPINTTGNDLAYVALETGHEGYLVKDLPDGIGNVDIYRVKIPEDLLFADKLLINKEEYLQLIEKSTDSTSVQIDTLGLNAASPGKLLYKADTMVYHQKLPYADSLKSDMLPMEKKSTSSDSVLHNLSKSTTSTMDDSFSTDLSKSVTDTNRITYSGVKEKKSVKKKLTAQSETIHTEAVQTLKTPLADDGQQVFSDEGLPTNGEAGKAFTVQVYALKNHISPKKLKHLGNVKQSIGNDGYARYSVGIFKVHKDAEAELERIKKLGISDAFIREAGTISNYFTRE